LFAVDFCPQSVKDLSPLFARNLFLDLSHNTYANRTAIFTDGSKTDTHTGSAFVIPSHSISGVFSLPLACSVLTAELYAIYRACRYISANRDYLPCVVFTDSKSALSLLSSSVPSSFRPLVYAILSDVLSFGDGCVFQWIPSHMGIPGNEEADRLAKVIAPQSPVVPLSVPSTDFNCSSLDQLFSVWQRDWVHQVQVVGKGSALFLIRDSLKYWSWCSHRDRSVETGLARLRVGHVGLAQYLFRFGMADSPLCLCGDIESVSHYLLECPLHQQFRRQLKISLESADIEDQLTVKLLLGGSALPSRQQFIIQSALAVFLRQSQKLQQL
jgi:ribonuclease HI